MKLDEMAQLLLRHSIDSSSTTVNNGRLLLLFFLNILTSVPLRFSFKVLNLPNQIITVPLPN